MNSGIRLKRFHVAKAVFRRQTQPNTPPSLNLAVSRDSRRHYNLAGRFSGEQHLHRRRCFFQIERGRDMGG